MASSLITGIGIQLGGESFRTMFQAQFSINQLNMFHTFDNWNFESKNPATLCLCLLLLTNFRSCHHMYAIFRIHVKPAFKRDCGQFHY